MNVQIGVLGEALIDFINQGDNQYLACLGGAPFNVALATAKQQCQTLFLSPLSNDYFGQQLKSQLDSAGITHPLSSSLPTSLAMVNVNSQGGASYGFYRQGVADRDYSVEDVSSYLTTDMKILHTGGLALCHEDREKLEAVFSILRQQNILISLDVNARPQAQTNVKKYYASIKHLMDYADIIKLSDEDMSYVFGSIDYDDLADRLLNNGASLIALTFGAKGAKLLTKNAQASCDGIVCQQVVDTIGSGDVFIASLISWLLMHYSELSKWVMENLSEKDLLSAVQYVCTAATINVERVGCQPPTTDEIINRLASIQRY